MKKISILFSVLIGSVLLPNFALAHTIGGNSFTSGALHPISGLDHLLAMVAVGIISVQLGNSATWKLPITFVFCMSIGGLLGMIGIDLPAIEYGIALSVLLCGVAIAASKKIPLSFAIALTVVFAIAHGYAHGAEMPTITHPMLYTIGFLSITTLLHTSGILIGRLSFKHGSANALVRTAGATTGVVGALLLTGIL